LAKLSSEYGELTIMTLNKGLTLGLLGIAAMATSGMAQQQQGDTNQNFLGIEGGFFMPTDSVMRGLFGTSVPALGFSVGNQGNQADKWRLTANFNFVSANKDGNRFFILPVTAAIGRIFGDTKQSMRPYVRVGVGMAYMDYSLNIGPGNTPAAKRFAPVGNAEVGVIIGERFRIAAAYYWLQKVNNLDFSGLQLTLSYSVLRF
jgi:hypothetical protein